VEEHLVSCPRCSAELAGYHRLLTSLSSLQDDDLEPPPAFLDDVIRAVRTESLRSRIVSLADFRRVPGRVGRVLTEPRVGYALASLGGAAVGATAIALVWWRVARKAMTHGAV